MVVRREPALAFLVRNPELPRSLRFAVQRIGELLDGIDPAGARYPLAPPHRMALHLAATVEMSLRGDEGGAEHEAGGKVAGTRSGGDSFDAFLRDSRTLHNLVMAAYVDP